ncbi:hypothetical protein D3C86_1397580 [compost metagenome]
MRRVEVEAAGQPDTIAHGARPEQRQHDVRPLRKAPHAQRQPQILRMALNAGRRGDVDQAADAEHRVDRHAHQGFRRGGALALQQIVGEVADVGQVRIEVGHRLPHRLGRHRLVALGDGHGHVLVHRVVDLEGHAVHGLERIVGVGLRAGGAAREQGGEGGGGQCAGDPGAAGQANRAGNRKAAGAGQERETGEHGETVGLS